MTDPAVAVFDLTKRVFIPLAKDSLAKGDELAAAAEAFCDEPSAASLKKARSAWVALRGPWKQAEVMSFGPHRLFPWRTESRIDFWPARPNDITTVLNGVQDLSSKAAADTLGAANTGMPVAEFLLYGEADTLAAFSESPRRCDYLLAVTRGIHAELQRFVDAWTGDFRDDMLHPKQGERYRDEQEVFSEVINNLTFTVELVREMKLAAPLGMPPADPDPTLVESRFSGHSIEDALAALEGVNHVMTGCYKKVCGTGLNDLLRERKPELIDTYEVFYADSRAALKAISSPLADAVVEHPQQVQEAVDAVRALATLLQVEMTQALNVTLTFGGTDGD